MGTAQGNEVLEKNDKEIVRKDMGQKETTTPTNKERQHVEELGSSKRRHWKKEARRGGCNTDLAGREGNTSKKEREIYPQTEVHGRFKPLASMGSSSMSGAVRKKIRADLVSRLDIEGEACSKAAECDREVAEDSGAGKAKGSNQDA